MNIITSLVLLFIIKIFNPGNKNIHNYITEKYGRYVLINYRQLKKTRLKLCKAELDERFLNVCLNHHLYPKFLNFKLSIQRLQGSHLQRQFQRKILGKELIFKKKSLKKLQKKYNELLFDFKSSVSFLSYYFALFSLNKDYKKYFSHTELIHSRKLVNLGYNSTKHPSTDRVLFNLSDRVLSETEKSALSFGLNYCLTPRKIKLVDHYTPFEQLANQLTHKEFFNNTAEREAKFKSDVKNIASSSYNLINRNKLSSNLPDNYLKALKNLSNDPNIVILKPDKGNGTVIMNKSDYINKVNDIIGDDSKFKIETSNPFKLILRLEDKIHRFLRTLKNFGVINDQCSRSLSPTGSKPGILYGLPKVHKQGYPVRPILSAIRTPTYNMSKFLIPLIDKWATNEYTVKDTFNFVNEILNTENKNYTMVSFDIKSLYTNIPLSETINIILNLAFDNNTSVFHRFSKNLFKKFLELTLLDNYFLFNKQLYKQIDGLAMGSPIAPTLANIFLCYNEQLWLDNCPIQFKPVLYKRYMDDTFLLFKDPSHIDKFLNYLNNKHSNIKFTSEIEQNNSLPFLDILINKTDRGFTSSVYRKPTFTGLTMNFNSFTPFLYKINLIRTLIHRAYNICSSYFQLHEEFKFMTKFLTDNGFKITVIEKHIKNFLNSQYNDRPKLSTCSKQDIYFKLPFYGNESFKIKKNLTELMQKFYPQIKLNVVFLNNLRINGF